jgi:F-type H+-transporting ATPase subunit c
MKKKSIIAVLTVVMVMGMASFAMAGNEVVMAAGLNSIIGFVLAIGFAIGIAALGTGLAMGNAISSALQGTARNPEAAGKIQTMMIIGLALIESLCIYALLICFMLLGKVPALGPLMDVIVKSLG